MSFNFPYPGPIPPYTNVAIMPQNYNPSQFFISTVALGVTTTVTTTVNHNYVIGQNVRLIIPPTFGCRQLNEQSGIILSIPAANQFVLNIDSSKNVDSFMSSSATTQPQTLPIGDISTGVINNLGIVSQGTYIPGSFINISP